MLNQLTSIYIAPVTVCFVIMMLCLSLSAYFINGALYSVFIFQPAHLIKSKRYYSFFSSALLHGDMLHLAVNAFAFYVYGTLLERAIGLYQFVILMVVVQLLINMILFFIFRSNTKFFSLGSGGLIVFALTSSLLLLKWNYNLFFLPFTMYAFIIPVLYFCFLYFIILTHRDNVNHESTIIGVLAGLLYALVINPMLAHG